MNFEAVLATARQGRLYPSAILYGASFEERQEAAVRLARSLLCAAEAQARPCGECRQCQRIVWPEPKAEKFHPDFHVLVRDLRNTTSVEAAKRFLKSTVSTPFEARGQVFVVAEADSLSDGAADSLLKTLEEPPGQTPRHFMLLAGSRLDLSPTLRSRSLAVFLGGAEALDEELIHDIAAELTRTLEAYFATAAPVLLIAAAAALARAPGSGAPGWQDTRARKPWATAAAAVASYAGTFAGPPATRRALYALAQDLLDGWMLRLRAITAERILEGLVARHLAEVPGASL